jgi:hypothetical protein
MDIKNLLRLILLCFFCLLGVGWWSVSSRDGGSLVLVGGGLKQNAVTASPPEKSALTRQAGDEEARFQMRRRGSDAFLLGSPQVRRELNLSHEKSLRIVGLLNEAARLNRGGVMTLEDVARSKVERQKTDPETLRRRALEYLSPRQLERLQQISNQGAAPFLLNNSSIARKIGATPSQVRRVQKTQEQEFKRYQRLLKPLDDEHFAEVRSGSSSGKETLERDRKRNQLAGEYLRRCRAALTDALTPEQEKRWRSLLGEPFTRKMTYDTRSYPAD